MRACDLPSAPAVAVAEFSPMATRTESPGCDHPQIAFGLPRWRTMLSPKIGLTNGSGAAVWGSAPKALSPASARRLANMRKAFPLALGNLSSILPQFPSMSTHPHLAPILMCGTSTELVLRCRWTGAPRKIRLNYVCAARPHVDYFTSNS